MSLITFGYGFYKVFEYAKSDVIAGRSLLGPRGFGLSMISIGLLALVLGTYEHRYEMRKLHAEYADAPGRTSTRVISALIGPLGIAAFVTMIFRR